MKDAQISTKSDFLSFALPLFFVAVREFLFLLIWSHLFLDKIFFFYLNMDNSNINSH